MKFILCLAIMCMFGFASADFIPANGWPGLIKVPQVFLINKIQAELKIYVINPRKKIQLPLDAAQLANTIYFEVSDFHSNITANPKFPNTGLAPSYQLYSPASNIVIEIWNHQINTFVGGSVLTISQAELKLPSQKLTLQDSTGTFAGVAQLVYEPPANLQI